MSGFAVTCLGLISLISGSGQLPVADGPRSHRIYVSVSARFLFAFDENAHILWKKPLEPDTPVVTYAWGGCCLAVNTGQGVLVLDLQTGRKLWQTRVGSKLRGVAVSGDTVYISADGEVVFYEGRTGRVVGRMPRSGRNTESWLVRLLKRLIPARPVRTRILVHQTRKYVVAFDHDAVPVWKIPAPGYRLLGTSNHCGFLLSADTVKVFDLRTGMEIWRRGYPVGIEHVVIGSRTEVFLENGEVFLYDSASGKLVNNKQR